MAEQKRKLVAIIEENAVARGYVTVHTVNEDGQETATPRDIDLTPEQVTAFNAALAGILDA